MKVYTGDVLLALFVAVTSVLCEEITILQSATSDCPGELTGEICLTLEQFVSNPTYSQSSEIVLSMQSGRHDLSTDFLISSSTRNFTMRSAGATIACDTSSRSLTWTIVENIIITGISFDGCGTLLIDRSQDIIITGVSFNGCDTLLIEKSLRVNFTDVSILNSVSPHGGGHALRITRERVQTRRPFAVDPASHAFFRNVSFLGNSRESLIWLMSTVIFDRVTYVNNTWGLTVQARAGTIIDGNSGTIHSGPQATFNMTRSIFSNVSRDARALSVYINKAFISNSTFTGNHVGVDAADVDLTIDDSVFSHNFGDGALVGSGANVTMTRCTFMSNTVTDSVMSLSRGNFVNLRRSTFVDNRAGGAGGALSVRAVITKVTRCNFTSNSASLQGGAIFVTVYLNNRVTISRNIFTNNSAAYGGGFHIVASPSIPSTTLFSSDNVFEGNTASISGGAIYSNIMSGMFSVRNSNFHKNSAGDKSGGSVYSTGRNLTLLLEENTFDSNFASSCGVLYADHRSVTFMSNSFTNNKATGEVNGGGVACIRNAVVSIENSTFTYNRASVHAGVLNIDRSSVTISDSTFLGNFAASHGGVIYTLLDSTEYTISHTAFSYNSAGRTGGVVFLNGNGNQATVNDSIFSFNSAARGGAVGIINTSLNITMSNIYNNTAEKGSAISACNSIVDVEGLNTSVDNTQPACNLYDGFVDRFDIVSPHDFNTLLKTTPTSNPPPASNPLPSGSLPSRKPVPSSISQPTHKPTHTNQLTVWTQPTVTPPAVIDTTTLCDEEDKDEVKRLSILVYTFVTTTIVLLVCVIALAIKLIYDCMKTKLSHQKSQSLRLGAVSGKVSVDDERQNYQPVKKEDSSSLSDD